MKRIVADLSVTFVARAALLVIARKLCVLFLVAMGFFLVGPGPSEAGTLVYDNGLLNGTQNSYQIDAYKVTNSFSLTAGTNLTGAQVGLWLFAPQHPSTTPSSLNWSIGTTPFGNNTSSGTGILANTPMGSIAGYTLFESRFALNGALSANTTYWLTLDGAQAQDGLASTRWDVTNGPSSAMYSFTNSTVRSESFQLYGNSPGSSQGNPILPGSVNPSGDFVFTSVPTGSWVDPPTTYGFDYVMTTPGSLFTKIDDFPAGFGPVTVSSAGHILGTFSPGQSFNFSGNGVSEFSVTGLNPLVDASNPGAFPLQLEFSSPTASFKMHPLNLPEPSSLIVSSFLFGLFGVVWSYKARWHSRYRKGEKFISHLARRVARA